MFYVVGLFSIYLFHSAQSVFTQSQLDSFTFPRWNLIPFKILSFPAPYEMHIYKNI